MASATRCRQRIRTSIRAALSWFLAIAPRPTGCSRTQIARVEGYRVIKVDMQVPLHLKMLLLTLRTGDDKKASCMRFGATHFLDFEEDDVHSQLISLYLMLIRRYQVPKEVVKLNNKLGVNVATCTAGPLQAYRQAVDCARKTDAIVYIGIDPGHDPISPFEMVRRGKLVPSVHCTVPGIALAGLRVIGSTRLARWNHSPSVAVDIPPANAQTAVFQICGQPR